MIMASPADLKARFPAFSAAPDTAVAAALAEAASRVDATWAEADRDLGLLLHAAHSLTLDGHGSGEGALMRAGGPDLRSLRSGSVHIERRDAPAPIAGGLGLTSYGRRFHDLLLRNAPGVTVV
ncbi:DUF4054 domain-containing protein [Methylobacterium oryzihabitans]|uniref:DUF4054 domain-containing protein n=2 Tax=Methylobacterium oryzihabitans TaxID=2499852 RepID=A0A437PHR2_9HYPH|nr:DUF4054 domain-containing protein [Methylobacterium oryzihabitans]